MLSKHDALQILLLRKRKRKSGVATEGIVLPYTPQASSVLMGTLYSLKGKAREERFYYAFTSEAFDHPHFYVGMRRATEEEDRQGTDFFMQTTAGEIPFNVKSSFRTLRNHKRKKAPQYKRIIGFVVGRHESAKSIRKRAFLAARAWREKFLQSQATTLFTRALNDLDIREVA